MQERIYSAHIRNQDDMARLEEKVGSMLGGEQSKCAFTRSSDFINLRLRALYKPAEQAPLTIYGEGLKLVLDSDKNVTVYLLQTSVEVDSSLGKRPCPEDEEDAEPCVTFV